MTLLTTIFRAVTHSEKLRAEHVRDQIFEASGTYYYVPKGSETGYRLSQGEAASIAARADANMQTAQKRATLAVFICAPVLAFAMPALGKTLLPAAVSSALPGLLLLAAGAVAAYVHHRCLAAFDSALEADLNRHPKVPLHMLRDPAAASSFPKIIRYVLLLISLPLFGLMIYAACLPLAESNQLIEKFGLLVHWIHLPLLALSIILAVQFYYKRKKRGF